MYVFHLGPNHFISDSVVVVTELLEGGLSISADPSVVLVLIVRL